jgi:hypothetical protein
MQIKHTYQKIDGWFNMEEQYLQLMQDADVFVELGAWKGKSTAFIVTEIVNRGSKCKFYTVDTFAGVTQGTDEGEVKAYTHYDLNGIHAEYERNTAHLKQYYTTLVSESDLASDWFADGSIDAIFIDAGHSYEAVMKDLRAWHPKMKKGAMMAGHDYESFAGVHKAVNEFFPSIDKVENNCWFVRV